MDRLVNTVRPYAWGSLTALPELLGQQPTGEPQAELWMGAHPGDPSRADRGEGPRRLDDLITADPEGELGAASVARFGPTLPFLLKVLAVGTPLSLQAHPTIAQARAGFAAENALGIPLDAPERSYRDANHKPEMVCALSEFEGLCGFRRPGEAAELMARLGLPELDPLIDLLGVEDETEALRGTLAAILTMDDETARQTVGATAAALAEHDTGDPDWYYAPYARIAKDFPDDRGLIAGMLLNRFKLRAGEALYLGAGVPHAYLSGVCVELQSNSDNVLRAGLTPKHIDVPELLEVVLFESAAPGVQAPVPVDATPGEELYPVPIDEFRLSRFTLDGLERAVDGRTPQILLCTEGSARLTAADGTVLDLARGQSAFLPATGAPTRLSGTGATLFRATVTV
ncbi:mannose-6-phosphate isomerase, class I [Kitasatospora xanthocidica]|uniref:mannose-6-phosphate isomerase, class I n=1 Tax=Kitasatospora xanthocidica TaxID=83382 RepID=UPI001672F563|nr:mannose-6-phosphate isomerase, class I [Kitasatospora xanthocidica]GHF29458.1 mannose-6-phosphate isomerase, class I [Kitasatospora xanthocidica]